MFASKFDVWWWIATWLTARARPYDRFRRQYPEGNIVWVGNSKTAETSGDLEVARLTRTI